MLEKSYYIRLCVLGSKGSGKTSLISRFVNDYFPTQYTPTDSLTIYRKLIFMKNLPVMLEIDDLFPIDHPSLSQPESENSRIFEKIIQNKTQNTLEEVKTSIYSEKPIDGMLFLFDLTQPESLQKISDLLKHVKLKETERLGKRRQNLTKKILVGSKNDFLKIPTKQSEVTQVQISNSVPYLKYSAKSLKTVSKVFSRIIESIFQDKFKVSTPDLSFTSQSSYKSNEKALFSWCDCSRRSKSSQPCLSF